MPKAIKQTGGQTNHQQKEVSASTQGAEPRAKTGNIFDDAVPVADLSNMGYKFLVFGESGTGKTTLACTFPKPLLLIRPEEVEDGSLSVRKVEGVWPTPPVTDPDQIADVCTGQRRTNRYKTIVLDGVTRLQDLVVKKHMGLADVPIQQTWGLVPQADWNRIGITMKEYLRDLMRLADQGVYVVIVGGERTIGGGESDGQVSQVIAPSVVIALTPGTAGWLHAVGDYNIHTFKKPVMREIKVKASGGEGSVQVASEKSEFCIHMGNDHPTYAIKFRMDRGDAGKLPNMMSDPSFAKIQKLIQGK